MATTMDKFAAREFYTVVIGGSLLSTLAGFINAAVLTGSFHVAVTHVTGSMTRLGSSLATGNWPSAGQVSGLTLCFFLGSATAGATIDSTRFQLGRSYGIALLVEAAILVLAWILLNVSHPAYGSAAAAYACGLQNAFCTGYSGAVLRTTHMTGITTDLGILFGQILARNPRVESWKIKVFGPLWIGYLVGGILGTWGTLAWGDNAILIPAVVLCMAGVFYLTWGPAREARELLAIAVKKVQVEVELGISKTVDVVLDTADVVVSKIPAHVREPLTEFGARVGQVGQLMIPATLSRSRAASAGSQQQEKEQPGQHYHPAHGFHPIQVPQSPMNAKVVVANSTVAQMIQQVHTKEVLEREIDKTFKQLEMQKMQEMGQEDEIPINGAFVLANDDDDDDNEQAASNIARKAPPTLMDD